MIDNEKNSQTRYPYFQIGALSIQFLTPEKKFSVSSGKVGTLQIETSIHR